MEEGLVLEILKWIGAVLVASAPGIFTLLKQKRREKSEEKVREDNNRKITLETTEKVQAIYQEMIEDIKKQTNDCKEKILDLTKRIEGLTLENTRLTEVIEKQTERIRHLQKYIESLLKDRNEIIQ